MKTQITIAILLLTIISVPARLPVTFLGWDQLKAASSEIIIAVPEAPTPSTTRIIFENGPCVDFSITLISVLKGTNGVHHARLRSDHDLQIRYAYLVFANQNNGIYKAEGDFSVVPLGTSYKQEMIAGKPLDEQIRILFQLAVANLNGEIARKQAEKQRLEAGIQNWAAPK